MKTNRLSIIALLFFIAIQGFAQTSKVIVGATTAKAITVTKRYKKSLQQIQDQLRFQVESQYRVQPIPIPIVLPTIDSPKIPTIDTTKFRLHRIILLKTETLHLQKKPLSNNIVYHFLWIQQYRDPYTIYKKQQKRLLSDFHLFYRIEQH